MAHTEQILTPLDSEPIKVSYETFYGTAPSILTIDELSSLSGSFVGDVRFVIENQSSYQWTGAVWVIV